MFLLMLTLMSRVFSLVIMLCLCASENQSSDFEKRSNPVASIVIRVKGIV